MKDNVRCSAKVSVVLAGVLFLHLPLRAEESSSTAMETTPLTLDQCREWVLEHNLGLLAQRLQLEAVRSLRKAEGGEFEPAAIFSGDRVSTERLNTVEQRISQGTPFFEEDNRLYSAAIEQLLPTGGRLRFGYTTRELRNNLLESRSEPAEREYDSFLGASIMQPLLRNAGLTATLSRIRLARAESEIAFQELRQQMMQTLARAETAYWQLYLASEQYRLREESVRIARSVLEDNRARVEAGKMSELEVQQAGAGLALRIARSLEARQRLAEADSQLRTFFAERVDTNGRSLSAATEPQVTPLSTDQADTMNRAMALHPGYLIRRQQAAQEQVRLAYAGNQRWPELDLKASYGLNGLGEDHQAAWRQIEETDYTAWSVGVELRIPLGGGLRGRHELDAAKLRQQQSLLALKAAEVDLGNALSTAMRGVHSYAEQVQHYQSVSDLMEQVLADELVRLDEGQSDSRKVLQAEEDLADARDAASESMAKYMIAKIEMELAGGLLLENRAADPILPPLISAVHGKADPMRPVLRVDRARTVTAP